MSGRARAPGKIVLSGAYVVLDGAPALVAAVDRFVEADADAPAERVTEEVRAAIALGSLGRACGFDASSLRTDGGARKIGLGSSAAILVATMAAVEGCPTDDAGRAELLQKARAAHRAAQGGGSGVDVAASVLGGILHCTLSGDGLEATAHALPTGTRVTVLGSTEAASTPAMLSLVRAHAQTDPVAHARLLGAASRGAGAAALAVTVEDLVAALGQQRDALGELGDRAGAPIVTPALRELARVAAAQGCFLGPAGAGGGDVAVLVGRAEPPPEILLAAARWGLRGLGTTVGARGVHEVEAP